MFVLILPTHGVLACGPSIGPFLDRVFADGVGDHLGRLLVGGGEVNLVPEIEQEDIRLFPASHRRDVGGGRLGRIDRGCPCSANLVHDIVIGNPVFADENGFLGFIQNQDNQVLFAPFFVGEIITPQGVQVEENLQEKANVFFFYLIFLRNFDADEFP